MTPGSTGSAILSTSTGSSEGLHQLVRSTVASMVKATCTIRRAPHAGLHGRGTTPFHSADTDRKELVLVWEFTVLSLTAAISGFVLLLQILNCSCQSVYHNIWWSNLLYFKLIRYYNVFSLVNGLDYSEGRRVYHFRCLPVVLSFFFFFFNLPTVYCCRDK